MVGPPTIWGSRHKRAYSILFSAPCLSPAIVDVFDTLYVLVLVLVLVLDHVPVRELALVFVGVLIFIPVRRLFLPCHA